MTMNLGGLFRASILALALAVVISACSAGGGSVGGATATTTRTPSTAVVTVPPVTTPAPPPGPLGPERVAVPDGPVLGPVVTGNYPKTIDGIVCQTSEQVVYHIHAHLTVFVDGQPRQVPFGIGIAPPTQVTNTPMGGFVARGTCFYWLHTHSADGVLHIESPTQMLYTLGQFFDVWGQPLSISQVGPAKGTLTAFVDGHRYTGNPRDIPLQLHNEVQIDVGAVVAPERIDWSQTKL